mgnify:CR=1 FL=1
MVNLQGVVKIVKKIGGNSLGIIFTRDERRIIGIKEGNFVEINVEKINKKKENIQENYQKI